MLGSTREAGGWYIPERSTSSPTGPYGTKDGKRRGALLASSVITGREEKRRSFLGLVCHYWRRREKGGALLASSVLNLRSKEKRRSLSWPRRC